MGAGSARPQAAVCVANGRVQTFSPSHLWTRRRDKVKNMFFCCMAESCNLHKSFPQKPFSYLTFSTSNVHTMGCIRCNSCCTVVICVRLFPGWFQGWCWQRLRIQFQDGVRVWIQTRPAVWTKQRRNQRNSYVGKRMLMH